jgi:hypothetical protein
MEAVRAYWVTRHLDKGKKEGEGAAAAATTNAAAEASNLSPAQ